MWVLMHRLLGGRRARLFGGVFLLWLFLMLASPKISHSPDQHLFADKRNFLGIPNTLNVISNFPFLVVGVLGFVLCLQGNVFVISLRGEIWGWAIFYAGITAVAFGSAYYHLKPVDSRAMWDTLPMMIAYSAMFSCLIVERVGARIGLTSLVALVFFAFISTACERNLNDLRLCMMFQLIPCLAIPCITFLYTPKYTHSRYWHWTTGAYLLAKLEANADRRIYDANHYIVSGHTLEHLCLVMVPILLTVMLIFRRIRTPRLDDLKERP
ncbi:hypothetical protein NMG60_11027786 [Bertholletia excelsa]